MTERCNEAGYSAHNIWKLEEKGLATPEEVRWRKRDDALTGVKRPPLPGPAYAPLTLDEFSEATGAGYSFARDNHTGYDEYLKGFYRELGRAHCHQKRVERDARNS